MIEDLIDPVFLDSMNPASKCIKFASNLVYIMEIFFRLG